MRVISFFAFVLLVIMFAHSMAHAMGKRSVADIDGVITGKWRYKITVVVDTPDGPVSGSAVREAEVTLKPNPGKKPNPYHSKVRVTGEAVVVDLGRRGLLYALLEQDDYQYVLAAFPGPPGRTPEGVAYYVALKDKKVLLNPEIAPSYPRLVTFADSADPKSIEIVLWWKRKLPQFPKSYVLEEDNFEKIFGDGVSLNRIELEMTSEPVTRTAERYLPVFDESTGFREWVNNLPYGDPRRIGPQNFR